MASTALCSCVTDASMLPDTYACCPAIRSETAVLAGLGPPTLLVEADADRGEAFGTREASRELELVDDDD